MADADSQTLKSQKGAREISSDQASTSKFFNHFLYKAGIVVVFFVLLPFFPSQAPEFISQTINARSWELLQLVFVGIAVSYGLFSKKNDGAEKDNSLNFDNAHSYVSKLLQVSSVFDDEAENQTVIDENKVETWNSQYFRGEPVVLVAKDSSGFTEEKGSRPGTSQKPLLLPVRSLKQRVFDPKEVDLVDGLGEKKGSFNRTSSKRCITNSRKSRIGDFDGLKSENLEGGKKENAFLIPPISRISRNGNSEGSGSETLEGKMEESVVFRSPIPWRSRSGRMEMKENEYEDSESNLLESRSFKSSRPNSSPKKLSPSPSFSSESHAKNGEDVARKKDFSSPPPAPPPPSLPKLFLSKSKSSTFIDDEVSSEKVMRRSERSLPLEQLSESALEQHSRRMNPSPELRAKSVRTFRTNDQLANHMKFPEEENHEFNEKASTQPTHEESEVETEDDSLEGRSDNEETTVDDAVSDSGPDVDKKADEFIAKFREQIRLQRIESIRKLTIQHAGAGKA
ncbi:Hydroxyproline-rich glycoprotein family protein [Dorcoceras hygrometricum]|uniref:Hydroxyproline-rich glycoprotein family protein n=1 Tax=Dorcoceras hygrometricum TaxID=472368 RepID=A0A2Z7D227_9LAMI|nr:Hydroxyproline-rich glycoprotein family protein [Dorcoceras hygrometricum]